MAKNKGIQIDQADTMRESRAADAAAEAAVPDDPHAPKPDTRAHMWERAARVDETPDTPKALSGAGHELPRWVHKGIGGEQRFVQSEQELDEALADGFEIHPTAAAPDAPVA